MTEAGPPVVNVRGLGRVFDVSRPWLNRVIERAPRLFLKAVTDVSFVIAKGETFALVGESGSGKSTVAKMIVGLLGSTTGEIEIDGIGIGGSTSAAEMRQLRRRIQMIFQDPYASLNPRWRVDDIIGEPLHAFDLAASPDGARARVAELL
jgi:peptide/nickel transport system ATP-binding protein